jgi:glycosyltransferase involved in cell wall biosynthesis
MFISIITVTLNNSTGLRTTIDSVISQTYTNFEYIVVDGMSTDDTNSVLMQYASRINKVHVSRDDGIYEAMNRGLLLSGGEYLIFMNGGDIFVDRDVLERVSRAIRDTRPDIAYGGHIVAYPNEIMRARPPGCHRRLWQGSQFSHQAAIIRSELLRARPYDTRWRFASDFETFWTAFNSRKIFQKLDLPIAKVLAGGVSDTNRLAVIGEWQRIVEGGVLIDVYFTLLKFWVWGKLMLKRLIY